MKKSKKQMLLIGGIALVVFTSVKVWDIFYRDRVKPKTETINYSDEKLNAYNEATRLIKEDYLKAPSTNKFPSYSEIEGNVEYLYKGDEGRTYGIKSFFDSQDSYDTIRRHFTCLMTTSDGKIFYLTNLQMTD